MNDRGEFRKRELQNLKYYNNVIHGFNLKIEDVGNILTGVKAIDSSKQPRNGGELDRTKFIELKNRYIKERSVYQARVDEIMSFLNSLGKQDKIILVELYCKNTNWDNVALDNHMSKKMLWKTVKRLLEK